MAFIIGKCQLFIPEMCIGVLTTFIQACSLNRKRKAHKTTCLYPLEIPDLKPPDTFGIPIVSTPPCLRNSSSKNPPLPSEFQKAVRRTVRIFSGIAHCHSELHSMKKISEDSFLKKLFFPKFKLLNSGCGLSAGAAYLRVFTVSGRPKAKVSRLRHPGTLRAQPCFLI